MIKISAVKQIHNIVKTSKPSHLYDQLKMNSRKCKAIALKSYPNSKLGNNSSFVKGLKWYNQLPNNIKELNTRKFKKAIKKERTIKMIPF